MAMEELKQKIHVLGYDVRSLEFEDGVFNARIVDRESGLPVKAKFDHATGKLLRAALGAN